MKSMTDSILRRIRAKPRGWVFTPKDFVDIASKNVIGVTLYRLAYKGIIRKIGHGTYDLPIHHPRLGKLTPSADTVASIMAAQSGNIIQPSGAQLANQLGLDMQVPAQPTYLSSGSSVKKKIANYPITFIHSKFVNKNLWSNNSTRVINALHHIGKKNITDDILHKCQKALTKKDKSQLKRNLKHLPYWMIPYILKLIRTEDERAVRNQ